MSSRRLARRLATPLSLGEDLLVLAPHPDDETLGCGGTIELARRAGARVTIAFLSDGADSHAHLLDRGELVALRRAEATAAGAALGVGEEDLRFLALPDGRLGGAEPEARRQLAALLAERRPGGLLAPCPWDVSDDHLATARIAAALAAPAGLPVHGYATWFWDRWPWTATCAGSWPRTLVRAARGQARLLTRFRTKVELGPAALAAKRRALAAHRTQVERRDGNPEWPVLADVSAGRWLELNLAPVELFTTSRP